MSGSQSFSKWPYELGEKRKWNYFSFTAYWLSGPLAPYSKIINSASFSINQRNLSLSFPFSHWFLGAFWVNILFKGIRCDDAHLTQCNISHGVVLTCLSFFFSCHLSLFQGFFWSEAYCFCRASVQTMQQGGKK